MRTCPWGRNSRSTSPVLSTIRRPIRENSTRWRENWSSSYREYLSPVVNVFTDHFWKRWIFLFFYWCVSLCIYIMFCRYLCLADLVSLLWVNHCHWPATTCTELRVTLHLIGRSHPAYFMIHINKSLGNSWLFLFPLEFLTAEQTCRRKRRLSKKNWTSNVWSCYEASSITRWSSYPGTGKTTPEAVTSEYVLRVDIYCSSFRRRH